MKKDVVLKIEKETDTIFFIKEESYQQIKKEMCKSNDYYSENDLEKINEKLPYFYPFSLR